ncbi:MAG TPA: radical SAM protein [Planctomycetota bacterium]
MRILLLHPPDGMLPTVPYSSMGTLTGCLKAAGHEVIVRDISLEVIRALLVQERMEAWWDRADRLRAELERKPDRTPAESQECLRLQRLVSTPRESFAGIADALAVMRDGKRFLDPDQFNAAFDSVQSCYRFAFSVGPDNYLQAPVVGHAVLAPPTPSQLPDPPIDAYGPIVKSILEQEPDLVGITVPYNSSIFYGLKLARELRRQAPNLPIAMGGAAIDSEAYAVKSDPFYYQVLTYVMVGEGEVQFPRLMDALAKGEKPTDVKNLRWLAEDGTVAATELELVTDLNAIPGPDFSTLPLDDYLLPDAVATFQTSRGCYYGKCTFCSEIFRKGFRVRRPELVVQDMLEIYEKTGIRHFQLWDSLAPPKTLKRIAMEVKARKLPFEWMAETKFEKPYKDEEMIRTLAEGGCTFLLFGFESASSKVLDLIDKGNDLDDVEQILALMKKYGIRAGTSWFIGFPGESEAEADLTYDFIGLRRDRIQFSNYTRVFDIGDDTIINDHPERFGIEIFETTPGVLDYRYKDGTEHWDRDERDQAFYVRSDFVLVKNHVELHYAKIPVPEALRITGQYRAGPLLRQVAREALPFARFQATPQLALREYDQHPLDPGRGRFAVVSHAGSGARFEIDQDGIALLRALDQPRTFHDLAARLGLPTERVGHLLELASNRGFVRILVDEAYVQWSPDARLKDEAHKALLDAV